MTYCQECCSVEGGIEKIKTEDGEYGICAVCGMEESITFYDEDYGKDR